jgi:RNA polymerase sigma-70 factor (ECF subfamily)
MADWKQENRPHEDWGLVMEALIHGSVDQQRLAFAKLDRLISVFLIDLRAWDYRDQWEDLRQHILMKLVKSYSRGQLREPKAFVTYARTVTRNEFFDFLKAQPSAEATDEPETITAQTTEDTDPFSLRSAVQRLPEHQRKAVRAVYLEGKTYHEAARETAIPLGSLKRYLRLALERLRKQLFEAK